MPNHTNPLPTLGDTASTQTLLEYHQTFVQLSILQHALRSILDSLELREADPPMLDALDALVERFHDLVRR